MDLYNLSVLLAMGTPPQSGTPANPQADLIRMIGTFVVFGAIFYFVLMRPQQKRAKQQAELLKSIKSDDSKIEVTKSAVGEILERSNDTSES